MRWLFLPLPAGKPWTGATLHSAPLGGSESAVAYLARALAQLGEDVTVLTHGTTEGLLVDDVKYRSLDEFGTHLLETWDVVASSRWYDAIVQDWKAKVKVLWFHDLPAPPIPESLPVNKVVCLTQFHANSWGFQGRHLSIIGNGCDNELAAKFELTERNPNKLIWTSNPDRGLAVAAKIFQDLRTKWPDLELYVFGRAAVYGWDANAEAPFMPRLEHMENVFICDPLPKAGLYQELASSWAMFYPTYWPETYCIAALEAQVVGTPVIAPPLAALPETVQGGILGYDFLNAVSQLRNKSRYAKLSAAGREFAASRTWKHRAKEWIEMVNDA